MEHAATAAMIEEALDRGQLVVHAEPIVDLATGRLRAHELLVRLDHPLHGLLGPDQFLPTAEACGLAPRIDRWVIIQGLALAAAGHAVSLNLSATSLAQPELLAHLTHTLASGDIDPSRVTLELTETAMVADGQAARDFAIEVRGLGCSIALDDFGTGYNGFAHLKRLPVDLVKIDCEFVADPVINPTSRKIIASVVALAAAFDIATVAEGVEDEATRSLLVELGVAYGQGFGLGRPEPLTVSAGPQPPAVPPARPRR